MLTWKGTVVTVPYQSDSFIHSFRGRRRPKGGGGRGVPRSYCPPRFLGIAPAKRVKASFSSIVQEGISRRSSFQLARESAESDLDSGHLSPEHPTPFWKRPSSALYLQPGLLLPVTLGQAQQPTETSVFAQSRLQPASRPCSLPEKQPAELTRSRGRDEPSDFLCQGFIYYSVFHHPPPLQDQGLCSPTPRSLLPPQRNFQHDGPPPQSKPRIQPRPARPPGPKGPADHRDSVSSWQIFAKLKREREDPPLWMGGSEPCEPCVTAWNFLLSGMSPKEGGEASPPPAPSPISRPVSRCSPELGVRPDRGWGCWGFLLPQLMKSSEKTRSRQGSPGARGQPRPAGATRQRYQKFTPPQSYETIRICAALGRPGVGWGGGGPT